MSLPVGKSSIKMYEAEHRKNVRLGAANVYFFPLLFMTNATAARAEAATAAV